MKKVIAFVMLAVFLLGVMSSTASAALLGSWVPSIQSVITGGGTGKPFSSVIGAVAEFEGTLQAYSVSGSPNIEEQVFLASDALSTSLDAFNVELTGVYSSLSEKEQLAVIEAYSSLGVYLEELAEEANKTFQDDEGKQMANFEFQVDVDEKSVNKFGGYWIGFTLGEPPK
jgi:hypothetical protein